jgi:hypothetical protein
MLPPPKSKILTHLSKPLVPRPLPDPAEQARQRAEARRKQEEEERAALKEEQRRQERMRLDKIEMERQYEEEERLRKLHIREEIRRAAAERARKEESERQEEEERLRLIKERKQAEKERRLEESRRIEEWRAERAREHEERERERAAIRASAEIERKSRISSVDLSRTEGWVTMQTGVLLVWKRRYFKVQGGEMLLYKTKQDSEKLEAKPLDILRIRDVRKLMEWTEGDREGDNEQLQELEAIPNSFALDLGQGDSQSLYMLFTDTSQEKVSTVHHSLDWCSL